MFVWIELFNIIVWTSWESQGCGKLEIVEGAFAARSTPDKGPCTKVAGMLPGRCLPVRERRGVVLQHMSIVRPIAAWSTGVP